jgi:DNA helicase-2/ATP-dependent DNA helicase PcrA
MPKEIPSLKGDAKAAVFHRGSHVQILAGAGTGKTEVMRQRITELLAEDVPPEAIVGVTFNVEAGEQLKKRVEEAVEAHPRLGRKFLDRMNNCYIGTLHSFAFQLLQRYVPKYESYDVLDDHRLAAMLSREAKRIGLKGLTGKLYDSIEAFIANFDVVQNELIPLDSLDEPFKSMLAAFLERLESYRLLTYGQQIALAVRELERPEVFEQVHSPLRHLMVDEYQDINPAQERFIELLATPPVELCVVGDDDQSIYQWRGTDVENIVKFAERYPNVATYRISTNRRSVANIVDLANKFSKTIKGRLPKKMEAARPAADGAVSIWSGATEQEEANRIAQTIAGLVKAGHKYQEIAVLFRGWVSYSAIWEALNKNNIPVLPGGRTGLFKHPDALLFGRTLAFLGGIEWADERYAKREAVTIEQLEKDYARLFDLGQGGRRTVRDALVQWYDRAGDDVPANLVGDYHKLLSLCGVDQWDMNVPAIAVRAGDLARCTSLLTDFESIRRRARPDPAHHGEQLGGLDRGRFFYFHLATFVQNWAHGAYEGYDGGDRFESNAVEVATVHTAKGLEWPIVFLASLSANRFPSSKTGKAGRWFIPPELFNRERYEGTDNDERRLFYVAITRAKNWLSLSTHDAVKKKSVPVSPFLFEVANGWPPKKQEMRLPNLSNGAAPADEVLSLSFSELAAFADCGYSYRLRSDLGFEAPLAQELGYGKAVHHVLRSVADYARKKKVIPTKEQLDLLFDEDFYLPAATKPAHLLMKSAARKLVGKFVDIHGVGLLNVYAVERPFELHLSNAIVSGRADVIIRKDGGDEEKYEIDDYKVSEGDNLEVYDRQLRTYTSAGRREGLHIIEANVFDLKKDAQKRSVDISAKKIVESETEVVGLVERLKARDFVPSPGSRCRECDVRQLCKHKK